MPIPELLAGMPLTGLDPDAVLAACETVRDYCDWHIAPSYEETLTFPGGATVDVPTMRLTAVTSVAANGLPMTIGTSPGTVRWSRGGRLILPYTTSGDVTVTFTHGYDQCPEAVRAMVAKLAARGYVPEARVRSETEGPYATTYFDDGDELASIFRYRRLVVA